MDQPRCLVWTIAGALILGCAGTTPRNAGGTPEWREQPGQAELRASRYSDNSGLDVTTAAATIEQPVARSVAVRGRFLADHIVLEREPLDITRHASNQPSGHPPHAPDAVTSASSTVAGGEVAKKWRLEGMGGLGLTGTLGGLPAGLDASVRGSSEEDYGSVSGVVNGKLELFDRNTTATAFLGFGHDTVSPVEAPPGQDARWPASHRRFVLGSTVSQLLSPSVVVSGAWGLTLQQGMLANPYRRALVRTSLFPENVPDARTRFTAFAGVSWSPVLGTAFHVREGVYVDSWGVLAQIPEVAVVQVIARRVLLSARYRFYRQLAADFYEPRYANIEPIMTGDMRLGPIHEHVVSLDGRWTFLGEPDGFGSLSLVVGYEISELDYELLATDTISADVMTAGITATF